MSTDIYAKLDLTKKVREGDGEKGHSEGTEDSGQLEERGDKEERVVDIYESEDTEDSGQLEERGDEEERVVHIYEIEDTEDSGQLEERGDEEERVVHIYENVDDFRSCDIVPGPHEVMRENVAGRQAQGQLSKTMRRPLGVVVRCLWMLCLMLLVVIIGLFVIIGLTAHNHSADKDKYTSLLEEHTKLQNDYKSCLEGWQPFGRFGWYYMYTENKTWEESRNQCQNDGADLVVINSKEKQELISGLNLGNGTSSWIGLKKTEGNWTWVDGTPLTAPLSYWDSHSGRPYKVTDWSCAEIQHKTGEWSDLSCESQRNMICVKRCSSQLHC